MTRSAFRRLPLALLLGLGACAAPLETHYRELGNLLSSTNRMRVDHDPADAPVTRDGLVEDFTRVVFFTEHGTDAEGRPADHLPIALQRWPGPVTLNVTHGDSTSPDQRATDLEQIRAFAARLSRISGVPITVSRVDRPGAPRRGEMRVYFADREERTWLADWMVEGGVRPTARTVEALRADPPPQICFVSPGSDGQDNITRALVVINTETRDLMRLACIHEELTQAMGLYNDDDAVRPSIFNDDQEFALLTRHDELLLAMLYDPALTPGMTAAEARPLLPAAADRALALPRQPDPGS
ncbi:DUF2927 domain-containing protein [Oceanicella sp. SM1341]|uniref:DUF2927 domain-containing protein n=1 Tax=Oceanicella sp. SM1341 TaxID=1548889 RepID=UPI000E4710FD|nr:DUF2927 domain-containing protein [Oceanicella sp. SM1341]